MQQRLAWAVTVANSDGRLLLRTGADVPHYAGSHAMGAQMGQQNMFSGQTTDSFYNGGTSHFELTLYSDGKIKFQYKVSRMMIAEVWAILLQ